MASTHHTNATPSADTGQTRRRKLTADGDRAIGGVGWVAVAGLVASWDIWAALTGKETLSGAYGRSLKTPTGRAATTVATVYLLLHLQGWPRALGRLDPLSVAGKHIRRR